MSKNNDDELAQEGVYKCSNCNCDRKFNFECWQARTIRAAINFEVTSPQTILCCSVCKTPLNAR